MGLAQHDPLNAGAMPANAGLFGKAYDLGKSPRIVWFQGF